VCSCAREQSDSDLPSPVEHRNYSSQTRLRPLNSWISESPESIHMTVKSPNHQMTSYQAVVVPSSTRAISDNIGSSSAGAPPAIVLGSRRGQVVPFVHVAFRPNHWLPLRGPRRLGGAECLNPHPMDRKLASLDCSPHRRSSRTCAGGCSNPRRKHSRNLTSPRRRGISFGSPIIGCCASWEPRSRTR